jgi:hypothetical protein
MALCFAPPAWPSEEIYDDPRSVPGDAGLGCPPPGLRAGAGAFLAQRASGRCGPCNLRDLPVPEQRRTAGDRQHDRHDRPGQRVLPELRYQWAKLRNLSPPGRRVWTECRGGPGRIRGYRWYRSPVRPGGWGQLSVRHCRRRGGRAQPAIESASGLPSPPAPSTPSRRSTTPTDARSGGRRRRHPCTGGCCPRPTCAFSAP